MNTELERCIALLFRLKGKEMMTEKEFVYSVSMDLHWFSPKDAQRLLRAALESGLLKLAGGLLSPNFEASCTDVRPDYRPPAELVRTASNKERGNLFMELVRELCSRTKLSKKEVVSRINRTQESLGVDAEVAALVLARSLDLDMSERIPQVEREILSRGD